MSLETRSSSALFKRAEQLKRWEESETNREKIVPRRRNKKIQFSSGVVFLAACAAGDKDEVLRLLREGADIDTANVDGLTALHQLCIDDNLDMVEFLVENGADVNRGDNEGWTPLHATASCGFVSIAKYLIENGGDVAAANNDAELPVDLAETDEMEELLREVLIDRGIDCEEARNEEQQMMVSHAKEWLNGGVCKDQPHPKTGATSLHVAAAKGYIKVISILLQAGADINVKDFDGWTPLHAAAHWCQKEACEILVENFCDMDIRNCVGQTALDVADPDMVPVLEELRKKQATMQKDRNDTNAILNRKGVNTQKRRSSITRMSGADKSNLINKDASSERQLLAEQASNKVKTVEVEIENSPDDREELMDMSSKMGSLAVNDIAVEDEDASSSESSESSDDSETSSASESCNPSVGEEKRNRVNRDEVPRIPLGSDVAKSIPTTPSSQPTTPENEDTSLRRPGLIKNRNREETSNRVNRLEKETPVHKATSPTGTANRNSENSEVVIRRTQSFEDEKFYRRYMELQARIKAGSCPTLHSSPASAPPARSASLREKQLPRRGDESSLVNRDSSAATPVSAASNSPTATSPLPTSQVRRSFVPPVRDEESETQRKAHAKRVRETRRSTQGVTLEELKTAEQIVKKKNQQMQQANQQVNNSNSDQSVVLTPTTTTNFTATNSVPSVTATITTGAPTSPSSPKEEEPPQERRPSWRLRVDNGDRNKFLLEDARRSSSSSTSVAETPPTTTYARRPPPLHMPARPSSAPVEPTSPPADASVTIALRRQSKPPDDKEQDKENDIRNAQATQAVIQRRRKPKRRSTGVVHLDMDELNNSEVEGYPDVLGGGDSNEITSLRDGESGGDWSGNSRVSNSPGAESRPVTPAASVTSSRSTKEANSENGEIDYKKLYEASVLENERLREKLKKTEDDLSDARSQLEKSMKNSLSEMEKRERRAMERKLSEMEEELKLLEQLKSENQRLKDENGALIRVISKLSK
ncbi:Poly [ADP-ribose] polymerase tankyrase [Gryllus bimaculatus]|nr:Poly [ADP-ribose] polymerase tankyrase [Gryllus bimaculatus]